MREGPPRWALAVVLGLAVLAYLPALGGEFVFDDYALFGDPAVVEPGGPAELLAPERTRPLTYLTFWLDFQLFGAEPAGWHLTNLALHLGLVALLWGVLRRLGGDWAALIGAGVVALHPLATEAVSYVYGRAVVVSAAFAVGLFLASGAFGVAWEKDTPNTGLVQRAYIVPGWLWLAALFLHFASI